MYIIKEITRLINNLGIPNILKSLKDSRKRCQIPLSSIIQLILYSTIIGKSNFLAIDKIARKPYMKHLLKSNRDMIASDDTLVRNLSGNISSVDLEKLNHKIVKNDAHALLEPVLKKRCAIYDGSGMSGYLKEVLLIPGKLNFLVDYQTIPKRGKELVAFKELVNKIAVQFGENYFDLILTDGLYYAKNAFKLCREKLHAHLLVKTQEKLSIVKDADLYVKSGNCIKETGFDSNRMCSYGITVVSPLKADTIDYPLQLAIVEEKYSKTGKNTVFYVITDDLSLSPKQLRYSAHLRWRIENNGFKTLNRLFKSKERDLKNERCFDNLLWLLFISYNLFGLLYSLVDTQEVFGTEKVTVLSIQWLLYESLIEVYSINTS